MSRYMAWVNVPGCLPMDDDPPTFDTAADAWDYLCDERRRSEEDATCYGCGPGCRWSEWANLTDTMVELTLLSGRKNSAPGVVYGETPGYHGEHDLGLAYRVVRLDN